jgi:hypothetical protein
LFILFLSPLSFHFFCPFQFHISFTSSYQSCIYIYSVSLGRSPHTV